MTWVVAADIHLTDKESEEYRWRVFPEIHKCLDEDDSVTTVILAGDYTDTKDNHSGILANRFAYEIKTLAERVHVFMLKANHDYLKNADFPFFKFLGMLPDVHWINEPANIDLEGKSILFLPHSRQPREDWIGLDMDVDFIFCHQTFIGSKTSDHFVMDKGLGTDIFGDTKAKILAGDVHVPQKVGPVQYIGAPCRLRFGDTYRGRILKIDGKKITPVYTDILQKHKVVIRKAKDIKKFDINPGDQIKVMVTLREKDFDNWNDIKQKVTEYCEKNGIVLSSIALTKAQKKKIKSLGNQKVSKRKAPSDLLKEFALKEKLSEGLEEVGLSLIGE